MGADVNSNHCDSLQHVHPPHLILAVQLVAEVVRLSWQILTIYS